MEKVCVNCAWYEEEWEYCFKYGNHAPKDGWCQSFSEETQKPKEG